MFISKKISENLILNTLLTAMSYVFPMLVTMYISRTLSVNIVGDISFANTLVSYFSLLCMLGLPIYGMMVCTKTKDNKKELSKTVIELVLISLFMFVISSLLLYILVVSFDNLNRQKYIYLIFGLGMLFQCVGCEWFYKAIGNYAFITSRTVLFRLISLICIILFVKTDENYLLYALFLSLVSTANYLLNFLNLRKYITFVPVKLTDLIKHLKPLITFFMMSAVVTIYVNLDILMIGIMKGSEMVAYYEISAKIKVLLTALGGVIWNVTLPEATSLYKEGKKVDFEDMIYKSLRLVYIIQIPVMVFSLMNGLRIIDFLASERYAPAYISTVILLLAIIPIGISNILGGQALIPSDNERYLLKSEVIAAIVNLVLNLILIPTLSINGAAVSTLIAETVVMGLTVYYCKKILGFTVIRFDEILKYLLFALLAYGVMFIFRINIDNSFIYLMVKGIIYFALYVMMLLVVGKWFDIKSLIMNLIYPLHNTEDYMYYCPCCDRRVKEFTDLKFYKYPHIYNPEHYKKQRQDVICPYCGSMPRHRIVTEWFNRNKEILKDKKILYFACEKSAELWFKRNNISITTADYITKADLKLDVTDLDLNDKSYDVIVLLHVLEHVSDYSKALNELHRVLSDDGVLITGFPVDENMDTVYEEEVTSVKERIEKFGQRDHLRIFGNDSKKMLETHGFMVSIINTDELSKDNLPVTGPADYDSRYIYLCTKGETEWKR